MKIKKLLFFAGMLFPFGLLAQFTFQYPGFDEHYEINYVDVVNQDLAWAVAKDHSGNGNPPMFTVTQNGGENWQTGYFTNEQFLDPAMVFGFDELPFAFALLYSTNASSVGLAGVYATFDNGETWNRQSGAFENPAAWPDIVYFWNTTQGIAIGDPVDGYFDIYTTTDLGTTWEKIPQANIPEPLSGEAAIVGNFATVGTTIWFSTTKGRVYRSGDFGITWSVYSTPFNSFTRICFKDNNTGWLQDVGDWETTQLAETTNGGETWQMVGFTGSLLNWDFDYIPGTSATLVSSGAYLRNGITTSYDGGENWYYLDVEGIKFYKMDWLDWQTGWVGGYNENLQIPFLYKYSGPGIDDYIVYPLFIDFGDVSVGTSLTRNITVSNQGFEYLDLIDIYTNTGVFSVTPSSCTVDPLGGQYTLEVTFIPDNEGVFEDWVTIISNHPDIPEVNVHLMGNGFWQASEIVFDPESFNETLYTGQTSTKTLSVTNNSGTNINYQTKVSYDLSLGVLGWNYASTPLGCDDGILCGEADQAMFIKEFPLDEINSAHLFLGYDDGIRCWVNGTLVFDDLHGEDELSYWEQEIDITSYLHSGINRVSAVVFNGLFRGCCEGGFDCQLTVDGVDVIKRGDENYGTPEATWFYFGESGQQLVPGDDVNGKNWWEAGYGQYDWVLLGLEQQAEQNLESLGWSYQSAPFTGDGLLSSAPDNAQFIKDIEVGELWGAVLSLGFDDGCRVWINGNLIFDYYDEVHEVGYWDHEEEISLYLQPGRNRISVEVYNGIYGGGGWGGFDCQLLVDDIPLIKRGDENFGEPEAMWYVYGVGGQVLTPPEDGTGHVWTDMNYGLPGAQQSTCLSDLNWNYDSTPFNDRPDLLNTPPDNAQFIKDFSVNSYSWATLFLGFDDGCRVWINGNMIFDFHDEVHGLNYWDHEEDISGLLEIGRNRISVEVYNGVYGGGAFGSFDCQLIVDDVAVIKRGDENAGQPEAMWYYYGQAGQILTPPDDDFGLTWTEKDYGLCQEVFTTTLSGIIADGQTQEIQVQMNADGLSMGEYQADIVFTSENAEQETIIPVTLFVNSEGHLTVTPSIINFGDYYIGYSETIAVTLKNDGFEDLDVISIWSNSADIYTDYTGCYLDPGESLVITVTLDSYNTGSFNSTLYFETLSYSSITTAVPIVANRIEAPNLVIENLEYLWSYIASGQSETQNLHVDNWGGSPLIFTLPQAETKNENTQPAKPSPDLFFYKEKNQNKDATIREKPVYATDDIVDYNDLLVKKPERNKNLDSEGQFDIFYDDMENGVSDWTIENIGEGASQWHQVEHNSSSPNTSWWCGNEFTGTYVNGFTVRESIISPEIKLPPVENPIYLEFNEWYFVEDGFDQGFVDISVDGGFEWFRIREGIPGNSNGWVTTVLDISQFYNFTIKIRFFFDTGDDVANDFPGWFVDDVRIYTEGITFLSMTPGEGSVGVNEGFDISVTFDASGYSEGYYQGFVLFQTNDPLNNWFYLPAIMEVYEDGNYQIFNLPAGWSGISSYLFPENTALDQLFNPVSNDLAILQNLGNVYWPQEGVNTIGDWNYLDGYVIKLYNAAILEFTGTIPENRLIEMTAGWSLIPVLSINPVPATNFDILESLNIIKEVAGTGIYWPVYNINTLQDLQPGKSYLIHVSGDESFEYPPMVKNFNFKSGNKTENLISPWNEITRTPATHIVALPSECLINLEVGDIIGIFNTQGYCAGFVSISNIEQNHSIAVFGDDPNTSTNEGLLSGEKMEFRLWRSSTNKIFPLEVSLDKLLPDQEYFAVDGLSAISELKFGEILPGNLSSGQISIFPNPAGDFIRISSDSPISYIEISDAKGVVFLTSHPKNQTNPEVNLSTFQTGLYYVKIITTGNTTIRKVIKQ